MRMLAIAFVSSGRSTVNGRPPTPNPRRRGGPKDRWSVWRSDLASREGWTIVWVKSELLALRQGATREENVARAKQDLEKLRRGLSSRRPRATHVLRGRVDRILARRRVGSYLKVTISTEPEHEFCQDSPGVPGPTRATDGSRTSAGGSRGRSTRRRSPTTARATGCTPC